MSELLNLLPYEEKPYREWTPEDIHVIMTEMTRLRSENAKLHTFCYLADRVRLNEASSLERRRYGQVKRELSLDKKTVFGR